MRLPVTPRPRSRPRPWRARSGFAGILAGGAYFAVLALLSAPISAQSPVSSDLEVRAEVHEDLSVFQRSDLEFGTLVAGQGWAEVGLEDERTGEFRIVGQQNRDVEVTLDPPAALENGGEALDYEWAAAYNNDADDPDDPSGATSFEGVPSATFELQNNRPGNEGEAFLWVHGQLDTGTPEEPALAGSYQATFTATVVYP